MSNTELAVASGLLTGSIMFMLFIVFALWILLIVAHWRMFTKAGEKGWKSLVPIYADYTMFKIVWNTRAFWTYVALIVVVAIVNMFSGQYSVVNGQLVIVGESNFFLSILSFISSIGMLVYTAMLAVKTALAYGKGTAFAIGLFFLPNIFALILAFGSAQYQGPQE